MVKAAWKILEAESTQSFWKAAPCSAVLAKSWSIDNSGLSARSTVLERTAHGRLAAEVFIF
jgi:hypothetical protein